ncbi:MAG: GNAT family N-acetyltransferase [Pseudomonadota bacterium]
MPRIRAADPLDASARDLIRRHLTLMWASSPPGSVHAMESKDLADQEARFFLMEMDGRPVGMGAIKAIDPDHAELRSMHVLDEMRGRGLSKHMLEHLLETALRKGFRRVSLETGAQTAFTAARGLYASAGFTPCAPFAGYTEDPNSVFFTKRLG